MRDYGTATWEGGDSGCQHLRRDGRQGKTGQRADRAFSAPTPFQGDCGKCGARRIDSQIGLEPAPELWVEALVGVFREVRRVLRKDGCLFLNCGDAYCSGATGSLGHHVDPRIGKGHLAAGLARPSKLGCGLKPKDLIGLPWMLAFALRADGWYLRSDCIWSKPNPMPSSVTDRPTTSHEYLFLLAKSERYFMDMDAIREPAQDRQVTGRREVPISAYPGSPQSYSRGESGFGANPAGRNRRTVWTIATQPTPEAHFATFPEALVEPCILAGTSERGVCPTCGAPWERVTENAGEYQAHWAPGTQKKQKTLDEGRVTSGGVMETGMVKMKQTTGWRPTCAHQHTEEELLPAVVLDCFAGTGTVSRVASRLGRRSIGIELSEEYVEKIARKRTSQGSLGL